MRVAAAQLEPRIGDVGENLRRCRELGDRAGAAGAEWIVLPEFFTTGMGFRDRVADAALPIDGAGTELLRDLAVRHGAVTAGSFVCRDEDGHNRNAWLLVAADGSVLGRHDKDVPTMWENCFYTGGTDDGVLDGGEHTVGAAMCWEFMRSRTARRLRGRVDLVVGGSAWWSVPQWPPRRVTRRLEAANARTAATVAPAMARAVGAGVVHASLCGPFGSGLRKNVRCGSCSTGRSVVVGARRACVPRPISRVRPPARVRRHRPPPCARCPTVGWAGWRRRTGPATLVRSPPRSRPGRPARPNRTPAPSPGAP